MHHAAAVMPALAAGASEWLFIGGLLAFAVANGASMPAVNALIASTVDPVRRGTAFGLASSAQAVAFMVGPLSAAYFASVSLALGFIVCAACFVLLAAVLVLFASGRKLAPRPV